MKIETFTCERRERRQPDWGISAARILPDRRPRFCVQMIPGFSDRKEDTTRAADEGQPCRATQDAAVREYEFDERLPDDYGQFLRRLSRIRSEDRKIGYAYRTLCRLYKRAAPEISASDTPREVQRKEERTARFASSDLESARRIIERVKFEDAAFGEHEKSGLLSELCRSVRILL